MPEKTDGGTLWSQSILDSLFSALKRQDNEAELRELIESLKEKGYALDTIATRVTKAMGPREADRIRSLGGGAAVASARPRSRQRHRVTRMKLLRYWLRDARESFGDAFHRVRSVLHLN